MLAEEVIWTDQVRSESCLTTSERQYRAKTVLSGQIVGELRFGLKLYEIVHQENDSSLKGLI